MLKFLKISPVSFIVFLMLVNSDVQAQVILEPNIGLNLGMHEFTSPTVAHIREGTNLGFGLGARIGYKYSMFFGALDFQYMIPTFVADTATVNGTDVSQAPNFYLSEDWGGSQFMLGISAGVDLVMGLRGWLGYYFINNLTTDDLEETEHTGGAFKIGIGYKIIPLISLNAEYIHSLFSEVKQAIYPATVTDRAEMSQNTFYLSVSVPYELIF